MVSLTFLDAGTMQRRSSTHEQLHKPCVLGATKVHLFLSLDEASRTRPVPDHKPNTSYLVEEKCVLRIKLANLLE